MTRFISIIIILTGLISCSPKIDKPVSLDGDWYIQIDKAGIGESKGWYQPNIPLLTMNKIRVPANWEASLGEDYDGKAWYFCDFENPGYQNRTALNIGNADDAAIVWINGEKVGEHQGSARAFNIDITSAINSGKNRLAILIDDHGGYGGLLDSVYLLPFIEKEDLLKGRYFNDPVPTHPGWLKNAVIYELNTRQFSQDGTFNAVERQLAELKDLGVDIIWLMPVHPIGIKNRKGSLGSPYAVKDYYAVNPEFGTLEEFKQLVRKIHADSMRVIIDLVANHTAWDNALITEHPDWYRHNATGEIIPPNPDWYDVAQLDYANRELWQYMIDMMLYWVREIGIDGFRCDVADKIPTEFWVQARRKFLEIKYVFMLAEAETPNLNAFGFDMTYGGSVYRTLNEIAQGKSSPKKLDELLTYEYYQYPANSLRMRYTSNHDENSWNKSPITRMGVDGAKLGAVLTFTLPYGRPLIYNGQEAGNEKALEFFEKDPIDWQDSEFRELYQDLCSLYHTHDALSEGEMIKVESSNDDQVFAFVREVNWDRVLIITNFSDKPFKGHIKLKGMEGYMQDYFRKINLKVSSSKLMLKLNPWEYRVYIEAEFKRLKKQSVTIPLGSR